MDLKVQYDLGVADLEGPEGGWVLRRIVRQSRLLGRTGTPPWFILPAAVLRFRNQASGRMDTKAPAFDTLTLIECAGLRLTALLVEQGRMADELIVKYEEARWKKHPGKGHGNAMPTFELAIRFVAAIPEVVTYRQLDGSVISVNKGKRRSACPVALAAEILKLHQEIWPDVPLRR